MNEKVLGRYQKKMLTFIRKCDCWHTFAQDEHTVSVIESLEKRGLIEVDKKYEQFRAAQKV